MKTRQTILCGILAVILALFFAACGDDDSGDNSGTPPEQLPDSQRWGKWVHPDSTATLELSVDKDGVCTFTVDGTPMPHNATEGFLDGIQWVVIVIP